MHYVSEAMDVPHGVRVVFRGKTSHQVTALIDCYFYPVVTLLWDSAKWNKADFLSNANSTGDD